jgi:hypothetical protein
MFGFTSRLGRDDADPLQTRKTAAQWFRDLPALDVVRRQEHVIAALAGLRHAHPEFDLDRVAAILFLDAALAADRRRLFKWHLENLRGSAKLADRFWQQAFDVSHGFISAYEAALDAALAHADDRRWKICLARLAARLIHFRGVDALLRLFRGERVIPGRWRQLHALFARACDLGFERTTPALPGEDPLAIQRTVEQEYVHVLLLDRLHTGNLTPTEIDWASARLHAWSRNLTLDTQPRAADGFYVDLSGTAGLARHGGRATGAKVGYLDTAPLAAEIERAIAALREPDPDGRKRPDAVAQQRIAILEKIRPAFAPSRHADLRRHPRFTVDLAVDIRVGLARIAHDLAPPEAPQADAAAPARTTGAAHPQWRVNDHSAAGWRISAPGGVGKGLALGALVAMRRADGDDWMLGVVNRLARRTHRDIEAGMALIADRVVPVTLYARRQAPAEMSFVVDGIDMSTMGARFDGLFPRPPSRLGTRLRMRTLIIPASEHFEGRSVILATARSNYAVTLGHAIDQRADWSWVTIRVSGKASRVD